MMAQADEETVKHSWEHQQCPGISPAPPALSPACPGPTQPMSRDSPWACGDPAGICHQPGMLPCDQNHHFGQGAGRDTMWITPEQACPEARCSLGAALTLPAQGHSTGNARTER